MCVRGTDGILPEQPSRKFWKRKLGLFNRKLLYFQQPCPLSCGYSLKPVLQVAASIQACVYTVLLGVAQALLSVLTTHVPNESTP